MEAELQSQTQTGDEATLEASVAAVQLADTGMDAAAAEPADSGPQALARLIEYAPGRHIALPPHTTYALLDSPDITLVPGAAPHACGLLSWQGTRLPMIDLNALLFTGVAARAPRYALIVVWQVAPRTPLQYGAIALEQLPLTISVSDDAQCALPQDSLWWPQLALSCFRHAEEAVPILDTARLFGLRPE